MTVAEHLHEIRLLLGQCRFYGWTDIYEILELIRDDLKDFAGDHTERV